MAEPDLTVMLNELAESQHAFLKLLGQANEQRLYQHPDDEGWTAAMALVHIAEARQFFAGEIQKILATPGVTVGRTMDDPHRLQTIADHGHASPADIRRKLTTSYEQIIKTLNGLSVADLTLNIEHVTLGPHTLAEFIQRFLVGHDRAHVQQVSHLLGIT